ncbi:probable G-protein coupled receptor Mth-like 7 [Drosophila eugracilis]|uniref:probable G-protein coupled receptor Mth-like 7 n=1 Tax=Drosophila eugracilis TaxID=29029 RepID=UPI0007E7FA13|nr:probable G-protein coupled receptor Mth-like 7 [Drosophila eugracilis]
MKFLFKFFFFVLILIIVKKSRTDKFDCNYYDTVDISHIEMQNNTYLYDDHLIPANLTAEYDIRHFGDGSTAPVKKHLRACVCAVYPCIRICCPRKNMLAHGNCDDGLKDELAQLKPYIYLTTMNQTMEARFSFDEMVVIRDQFWECDKVRNLKNDEYALLLDGTLLTIYGYLEIQDYCIYPHNFNKDFPKSIWIVNHSCTTHLPAGFREINIISLICFFLTIAVYLYVKDLRNVSGKCLVCCILCRFIQYLILLLDSLDLLTGICSLAGYSSYFFRMASILWLSVISYHMWVLITSLNRNEPSYRFLKYSIFVWITSAIMTGLIYLINRMWENDVSKWNWLPLVGFIQCSVKEWNSSSWVYSSGPTMILSTFNVIMFILTAIHIWKVKSEIRKLDYRRGRQVNCLNFDSETYLLFVRLSVMMGLSWIMNVIPFSARLNFVWEHVLLISDYYHCGFGIVIFSIFILKRSTLKLLVNSYHCIRCRKA